MGCRILRLVIGIGLTVSVTGTVEASGTRRSRHPLDPLSASEITLAVQVLALTGKVTQNSRLALVALKEPSKAEVLSFRPGMAPRREARLVVYERDNNQTFEALVDVQARRLLTWKEITGAQPNYFLEDFQVMDAVVRADPNWIEAMRKRGFTDLQNVFVCGWPGTDHGIAAVAGQRVLAASVYYKGGSRNSFARPIEGLIAFVDLNTRKVARLLDTGIVPVSAEGGEYPRPVDPSRRPLKPLLTTQPQGASFDVQGQEVHWQNWRFRFALHPREGLVLYTVAYQDQQKWRPILYRGSVSELFVPYGDPDPCWQFRNIFDMGQMGLGWQTTPLDPGGDCPTHATFFSGVFSNDKGVPYETKRAVALYERDAGILWKHVDEEGNAVRRGRQLVLSSVTTAGNYDYGFNWIFHQDGCLEAEVLLTGIMSVKGVPAKMPGMDAAGHGHLVAPLVEAVHHQHFFNFRLDMDVDGASPNSVVELNTEAALPNDQGPSRRGALVQRQTPLTTEQQAKRRLNLDANRRWKVVNARVQNSFGQPVGYLLEPGENCVPFLSPQSATGKRAGFIDAHFWATPYDAEQMHAAGDYIGRLPDGDGLPNWIRGNRSLVNDDVVIWYTLGVTHIPRPEEWPVMPVHRAGFKLLPCGFFDRNPALDVPAERKGR